MPSSFKSEMFFILITSVAGFGYRLIASDNVKSETPSADGVPEKATSAKPTNAGLP